tara:strand:+ start:3830 stop:4117 length:288 start_codon:yes stop_codon:yes gene_type:complete
VIKVFFLYLLIIESSTSYYWVRIPIGFAIKPITCDEAFNKNVKIVDNPKYTNGNNEVWVLLFYKEKYRVAGHFCADMFGNYYSGYEEKLNWELNH